MDKFSAETMQKIEEGLDDLLSKDPPVKSNEKLVGKYVTKMRAILDKGWPIDALVDVLQSQGINIQANTLRSYIQRQKQKAVIADGAAAACGDSTAQTADTPAAAAAASKKPKTKSGKKRQKSKEENKPIEQSDQDVNSQQADLPAGSFPLSSDEV